MPSGKNAYAEMPVNSETYKFEMPQLIHQPMIVAVDVSKSMDLTEEGQQKTNLKLAEDMLNQVGQTPELTEEYKKTTDFCVMAFSDDVTTEKDWMPLAEYHGGITLNKVGMTAFHNVVKQSLNAVHAIKGSYKTKGIQCKRPQIFVITDGCSTDGGSVVTEAKELCKKYVDTNRVALHVILLPGGTTSDAEQLSSKIKLYKVDDCAYGLTAIKDFINASIVGFCFYGSVPGVNAQDGEEDTWD